MDRAAGSEGGGGGGLTVPSIFPNIFCMPKAHIWSTLVVVNKGHNAKVNSKQ